jgi:hypothetical protein
LFADERQEMMHCRIFDPETTGFERRGARAAQKVVMIA